MKLQIILYSKSWNVNVLPVVSLKYKCYDAEFLMIKIKKI